MATLLHTQPDAAVGNLEYSYHSTPSPHIYLPQLLPPHLYEQISFPFIPIRAKGRSGRDLFVGESGHAEAVNSAGFKELYGLFTSARFVAWVLSVFEKDMIRNHCRAAANNCHLLLGQGEGGQRRGYERLLDGSLLFNRGHGVKHGQRFVD